MRVAPRVNMSIADLMQNSTKMMVLERGSCLIVGDL